MWEKFADAMPYWAPAAFAVASGQIGRLGARAEKGAKLTRATIFIELSMMPALGSIVGSMAEVRGLPVWQILMLGVTAGWAGFSSIQLIHGLVMDFLRFWAEKNRPK